MNVDIVGRIRPTLHGEGVFNLEVDSKNRLATGPGGNYFSFLSLYKQDTTNYEIYKKVVDPLLELFIVGYNVSLFLTGETGSGKTFTMAGESSNKSGILPITLENFFQRVKVDDQYVPDSKSTVPTRVIMQMFEIFSDKVRDLLAFPKSVDEYSELDENAETGVFVRHATAMPLRTVNDATTVFRQGWGRRSVTYTDFGPASNYTAVIVRLELEMQGREDPFPHRSRFTFVELPGLEKLSEDSTEIRLKEGPTLNKGLLSFSETVAQISVKPTANRAINYGGSKLTQLLRDEIGGNCKTRVVMCLKPNTESRVLSVLFKYSEHISKVKNFPVRNDTFLQQLITQYRAEVLDLKRQLGLGMVASNPNKVGDMKDQMRKLQTENLQLRDRSDRLHYRLEQVQNKFGHVTRSKADISGQLLMTEEEKLKVSKTLVEMQMENNRLLEELERTKFDLTNTIIRLENDTADKDTAKEKFRKVADNARHKLEDVEKDRRDLADEYVTLKTTYLALTQDHKTMSSRLDELCMELLNLVNAKVILMKQVMNLEKTYGAVGEPLSRDFGKPEKEVDRIRAMVDNISSKKFDYNQYRAPTREREIVQRQLLGDEERFEDEIKKVRNKYETEQNRLNYSIEDRNCELSDLRRLARERQQKISDLNSQLITSKGDSDNARHENNRLQSKMKDLNDEYKSRLNKWVEDIADYVDSGSGLPGKKPSGEKYKEFVDDTLEDVKKAHKIREAQLSEAATNFRQKMLDAVKKHEQLLVAYNNLRQEVQRAKVPNIELGAEDSHLLITEDELKLHHQKEMARLKDALTSVEAEIEAVRNLRGGTQLSVPGATKPAGLTVAPARRVGSALAPPGGRAAGPAGVGMARAEGAGKDGLSSNWLALRKHVREFTLKLQQNLINERAQLWTENLMLKDQVKESQEYIDIHLAMYKTEISKLRRMLGMPEAGSRMGRR